MGALIARLLTRKGEYRRVGCAWMRCAGVVCGMSALGWAVHGCGSVPNNQKKRFCNRVFFLI